MYTLPSKPEPIGVVLDGAVELYRHAFRACWPITLVGTAVVTGVRMTADRPIANVTFTGQGTQQLFTEFSQAFKAMNAAAASSILNSLLILLLELLIYAVLFAQMHHVAARGQALSAREALVVGCRRLPGMLVAGLIWTIAVVVGMFIFLVPGIFLWGKLEFWVAAAFVDDVGALGGLGRSWELTRGNWWRSVTAVSIAFILVAVFGTAADMLAFVVLGFTRDLTTLLLATQILQGIGAVFVLPMLPAAALAIYYDMKLRRDGADLLSRAQALQTA